MMRALFRGSARQGKGWTARTKFECFAFLKDLVLVSMRRGTRGGTKGVAYLSAPLAREHIIIVDGLVVEIFVDDHGHGGRFGAPLSEAATERCLVRKFGDRLSGRRRSRERRSTRGGTVAGAMRASSSSFHR